MCQQVQLSYLCAHKTPGYLTTCSFHSTPNHYRTVTTISPKAFCPACGSRPYTPAFPVTDAPAPLPAIVPSPTLLVFAPALILPQISRGPGSHGTPLSVPPNTATEVRWQSRNGRLQSVIHYHSLSASNAAYNPNNRYGYNTLHGYDHGSLPPSWVARSNSFPARGYNTLHGYDPGNPPPGWIGAPPVPVQMPASISIPVVMPFPAFPPAPVPFQPQVNIVDFANPVTTTVDANSAGNNTQGAAGATRQSYNSSTVATQGLISSSETLTETSTATSRSEPTSGGTSSMGSSESASDGRR